MSEEPTLRDGGTGGPAPTPAPGPLPVPPAPSRLRWAVRILGALGFVLVALLWFPLHDYRSLQDMELTLAAREQRSIDVAAGAHVPVVVNGRIRPAWGVESGNHVEIKALDSSGTALGHVGDGDEAYSFYGKIARIAIRAGDAPARVTLRVLDEKAARGIDRSEGILQVLGVVLLIPLLAIVAAALSRWMARERSTPCVRRRTGWIGIVIVSAPVIYSVGHGIISLIEGREGTAAGMTPLALISWAAGLWVSAVVVIALAVLERRAIGGRLLEMRASPGPVLVAMLALCALWYSWRLGEWLWPEAWGWRLMIGSTAAFPAAMLLSVSAGVCEELVYRGFLLTRLRELTGNTVLPLLATSVAFGLAHIYQSVPAALSSCVFGLILGVFTLGSRNLFPAILAHAAWDVIWTVAPTFDVVRGFA